MKDKDLLLKAIEYYDIFTENQRRILKILVEYSINNVVNITIKKLNLLSGVSKPTIYGALNKLEANSFIRQEKNRGSKMTSFLLNSIKFDEIIEYYTNELKIIEKYHKK